MLYKNTQCKNCWCVDWRYFFLHFNHLCTGNWKPDLLFTIWWMIPWWSSRIKYLWVIARWLTEEASEECFFFWLFWRYCSLYISYLHLTPFYQPLTATLSFSLCKTVYLLLFTSHSVSHPFHRSAPCMPELINRALPKQGSVFSEHPIITEWKTFGF